MTKVIIFGNSGSGKSTLAKVYQQKGVAHLDLDTLAWQTNPELSRRPLSLSLLQIDDFTNANSSWVIEGGV